MPRTGTKPSVNKKNFKRVLDIIKESARKRSIDKKFFDYNVWFAIDKEHKTIADVIKHPCGTSGCVGGWGAALMLYDKNPKCEMVELVLEYTYNVNTDNYDVRETEQARDLTDACYEEFQDRETALNKWFGITDQEAEYLFMGKWHDNELDAPDADVIAKLENIIKTGLVFNPSFDMNYNAQFSIDNFVDRNVW